MPFNNAKYEAYNSKQATKVTEKTYIDLPIHRCSQIIDLKAVYHSTMRLK